MSAAAGRPWPPRWSSGPCQPRPRRQSRSRLSAGRRRTRSPSAPCGSTRLCDLDGRLDEERLRSLAPITDFIQQEPDEGQPATEKTEAWILFDDANLYIAARCWDSHPEREVANELRRDNGNILGNENFTFVDRHASRSPQRLLLPDQPARRVARHDRHRRPAELGLERDLARADRRGSSRAGRWRWRSRSRRCAIAAAARRPGASTCGGW